MNAIKIGIIGSGPAGFYSAQYLLKHLNNVKVDLYEKLPVPFGLVRYGVAPDHPDVKNVINTFNKTASHPNFNYFGNVSLGSDIKLKKLQEAYHIVLLTYGADQDKKLGIPGENLDNVLSARRFVGWYNGYPDDQSLNPDLSGTGVTILGQGNVAIDVARILLTPIDVLKQTDITESALAVLAKSKIEKVHLVGRRGPLQAAFTIKELREMTKLPNCNCRWRGDDLSGVEEIISKLPRARKRLTELMLNSFKQQADVQASREFLPVFYRAPLDISKSSVKLAKTVLLEKGTEPQAVISSEVEFLPSDLVIRSIGYKSTAFDADLPFNHGKGVAKNENGKIQKGLYTTGWLGHGPAGVILTTMNNAFAVANTICEDIKSDVSLTEKPKDGSKLVVEKLKSKQIVNWSDWLKIDQYEVEQGKLLGKPREKIASVNKMLEIAAYFVYIILQTLFIFYNKSFLLLLSIKVYNPKIGLQRLSSFYPE